ncbi:MAG TPA: FtsX-like permease family protein [Gemmatimonadales bacterium]|nr:FtsX-like permease family protein [Gemmatimonadales bacterium]
MIARSRLLLRLSLRNVARNARRSTLTALAMVIGLALLVFSRSLADGAHEDWIRSGVRLGNGHVVLQAPNFQRTGDLADRLDSAVTAVAEAAIAAPGVERDLVAAAPRITVNALASAAAAAVPVRVVAVDPAAEARFSLLTDKLTEGRTLEPGDHNAGYIGVRLAHRLDLHLGSRFVVTAQSADGQIADQLLYVRGIFETGLPDVDEGMVQIPLRTARQWLGVGDAVTGIALLLRSSRDVSDVMRALRQALPAGDTAITVLDWRHADPALDAAVRLDDYGDYLMHAILLAIVALAIVNTMLMSVLHRSREFGILRALGLTRAETGTMVFGEGLLLTFVSGFVGLAIGAGLTWLFFRHGLDYSFLMKDQTTMAGVVINPVIIPELGLPQLIQSVTFIVAVGLLAALYPAYRATKIDLVEAMKFDE